MGTGAMVRGMVWNPPMLHLTLSVGVLFALHFVGLKGALLKRLSRCGSVDAELPPRRGRRARVEQAAHKRAFCKL